MLVCTVLARASDVPQECKPPLKNYRAFVIVKAVEAPDRGGWELSAPVGDTPDVINCTDNIYWTLDVVQENPQARIFHFPSREACNIALNKIKRATKDIPVVVVIDKNCTATAADD